MAHDPDIVAPRWTFHAVTALAVDLWSADERRRHLRPRYRRRQDSDLWTATRLWP